MRAAPVIIAAAVAGVAAVGVAAAVASDGDEVRQVEAVSVGAVTVDASDPSPAGGASDDPAPSTSPSTDDPTGRATDDSTDARTSRQVEGLDELRGVLTRDEDDDLDDDDRDDDDREDFEVAGVDLELGPDGWLLGAGPVADFDGDGTTAPVLQELEGLLGQEVVVLGRFDDDGDDIEVYELQGLTFRDSAGGPAPWQSGDEADALTRDQVAQAALDAVGAGSRLDSVDREDDGGATWEVEVYDAQGREQRVLLDAAGAVLDIRPED
ncbi:PepSY domain-containing protein [Aquipuribacter sp. MA13-6]|uniref:PepSY domain-containing protein n=1 Tax=unclassified Aquipuribacter TaxID=2635084 RepID=UPI003EEE5A44